MLEAPTQPVPPDPLDAFLGALRRCEPDEAPLLDLVTRRLRKDARLLRAIVESDAPSYEGSMNTIGVFLSTGTWPKEDHGWIEEALGLARFGYWYSPADRPSYARKRDGVERPGERITLETLVASALLVHLARHAAFACNQDTEPGAGTCLDIVDAAVRLGGPWPEAAMRFLADQAIYTAGNEPWRYDPVFDAARDVGVPLAMLVAWRAVHEDAGLPAGELFEALNALALARGVEYGRWHEPITCAPREEAPAVVRKTILDPVMDRLDRLDPRARAAAEAFGKRFIG